MIVRSARRLPGIQFESRAPRLDDALPRMDVAAFVGFAASGPLHTPVAVDGAARFADLFGDDVVLAWDRERCRLQPGGLGAAVRGFFANGGTRAWIVRVAGESAATNEFPIPGLLRLGPAGLAPAFATARSEGSWSDDLGVGCALAVQPATLNQIVFDGARVVSVGLEAPDAISAGDVLRLTWPSGDALLAPVASVDGAVATFVDGAGAWIGAGAPPPGSFSATWFPREGSSAPLPPLLGDPVWADDGTVTVSFGGDAPPEPGQLVRLDGTGETVWLVVTDRHDLDAAGSPPGRATELAGRFIRVPAAAPAPPADLPVGERLRLELWVRAGGGHPVRLADLGLAPGHPRYLGALPTDERLFQPDPELLTPSERALRDRLRAMIGDGVDLRSHHADLWQLVSNPRFPLAVDAGAPAPGVYLPVAMPIVADAFLAAQPAAGDPATRDGLGGFAAAAFLDPDLADESLESLPARADFVRWQSPSPRPLRGIHALLDVDEVTLVAVPDAIQRGWSVEDVVPPLPLATPVLTAEVADAQGAWRLDWTAVDEGAAFALEESAGADFAAPTVTLLPPGTRSRTIAAPPPGRTWFRIRAYVQRDASVADDDYFTVGDAEAAGSFWSDPVAVISPPPQFDDCDDDALGVPVLDLAGGPDASGSYRLEWTAVPRALRYRLEESIELDFTDAAVVFAGGDTEATVYGRAPGRYHYRVRAEGREGTVSTPIELAGALVVDVTDVSSARHVLLASFTGAFGEETVFDGTDFDARFAAGSSRVAVAGGFRYSLVRDDEWPGTPSFRAFALDAVGGFGGGVAVTVSAPPRRVLLPAAAYQRDVLLTVQSALVRLAAARGDVLAVLALPEHYRENDAVKHVGELRARLPEETPWSFGAVYHPWLQTEADAGLANVPPDGAACGVMAARAAGRGAWIAPANEPFGGVLGLTPDIDRGQWLRLLDAHVNLVRQEPHGFVALAADTLALDPDLVPINVRRLLSLLRRVALRLGPTFVFEPQNGVFRRAVEREFTALLDDLFRAGAFAGERAADSYQVVVDASDNPPASVDEGRFVVELKVAPSVPLGFLTVRLVQSDVTRVTEAS